MVEPMKLASALPVTTLMLIPSMKFTLPISAFTLPVIGASVNILPLLMVVMMVVQQKISQGATTAAMTDEQASQQKMMMVVFPLVFGFLFYNMPSGLVLYWLTNTILMTSEQKVMGRMLERG